MITFHGVRENSGLGTAQIVIDISIRVEGEATVQILQTCGIRPTFHLRIWITLLIMMQGIAVENHQRVLWNVNPIIGKVLSCVMRRRQPERTVDTLDLSQDALTMKGI